MVFDGVVSSESYLKITGLKRVWKYRSICFGRFCELKRVVFLPIQSRASYLLKDSVDCAIYFIF